MIRTGQTARTAAARTYVALLRGINVGGKNKLPMGELAEIFVDAGCTKVATYIQSGNVVFSAAPRIAEGIAAVASKEILKRFGFEPPMAVRSATEMMKIAAKNPFLSGASANTSANATAAGSDSENEKSLHVAFLADRPDKRRVAALDPNRSPGDSLAIRGRDVFLHLPNGVAGSKLTNAYLDKALGTISTIRNWRTVLKLMEMMLASDHIRSSR